LSRIATISFSTMPSISVNGRELSTTNCTGRVRKLWPSEGGLLTKARTPAMALMSGRIDSAMACWLRSRSPQGLSRRKAITSVTVGEPATA
jgi:hypothetical protein